MEYTVGFHLSCNPYLILSCSSVFLQTFPRWENKASSLGTWRTTQGKWWDLTPMEWVREKRQGMSGCAGPGKELLCVEMEDEGGNFIYMGTQAKGPSVPLVAHFEIFLHVLGLSSLFWVWGEIQRIDFHSVSEVCGQKPLRCWEKCYYQILFLSFLALRKTPNRNLSTPIWSKHGSNEPHRSIEGSQYKESRTLFGTRMQSTKTSTTACTVANSSDRDDRDDSWWWW